MIDIISDCKLVIEKIKKFSSHILKIGNEIDDSRFEDFEEKIGYKLPLDFKYILKKFNGITLVGVEIYGLDIKFRGLSLSEIYSYEHFEVSNRMPRHFLPFSPDGRGNHYCLDLSKLSHGVCPIVFWQWNCEYNIINKVEVCNDSFLEWIKEVMIEWTLEDFNFDGSRKSE
jgi:hypothetical protein